MYIDINKNFNKQYDKGLVGEIAVKNTLEADGWEVTDTTDIQEYRDKDIDLICKKNGKSKTVEIKTDYKIKDTGNFCFEKNIYYNGKRYDGCFRKSQADFWAYYDIESGKIYMIRMKKPRIYNSGRIVCRESNDGTFLHMILVPIYKLMDIGLIKKVYDVVE